MSDEKSVRDSGEACPGAMGLAHQYDEPGACTFCGVLRSALSHDVAVHEMRCPGLRTAEDPNANRCVVCQRLAGDHSESQHATCVDSYRGRGPREAEDQSQASDPLTPDERTKCSPEAMSLCLATMGGTGGGVQCELPVCHPGDHSDGDRGWPAERRVSRCAPETSQVRGYEEAEDSPEASGGLSGTHYDPRSASPQHDAHEDARAWLHEWVGNYTATNAVIVNALAEMLANRRNALPSPKPLPDAVIGGLVAFARKTWRDDGAEGETVHRLCDEIERRRASDLPCTCGSGGHPRECAKHPLAMELHCAEMSLENGAVRVHELKTWPEYLDALIDGSKTFEVRKNDRDYRVGDRLHLLGWNPSAKAYNGREHTLDVTYVMQGPAFGVAADHVVMGVKPFKNGANVMNAVLRLLADVRRETIEACAALVETLPSMGLRDVAARLRASQFTRAAEEKKT